MNGLVREILQVRGAGKICLKRKSGFIVARITQHLAHVDQLLCSLSLCAQRHLIEQKSDLVCLRGICTTLCDDRVGFLDPTHSISWLLTVSCSSQFWTSFQLGNFIQIPLLPNLRFLTDELVWNHQMLDARLAAASFSCRNLSSFMLFALRCIPISPSTRESIKMML